MSRTRDDAPLVSVVVPTRDYAAYLPDALDGVLRQDYRSFEILVVDDGSTDDTGDVVAGYGGEPRIRYLARPRRGVSAARNEGIRCARGRYVAFLDADDLWPAADKLARQVGFLERHRDVGLIFADKRLRFSDGETGPPYLRSNGYYRESSEAARRVDLTVRDLCGQRFALPTSSVMVRRRCLQEVGYFDENLGMYEDLDLWIRLVRRYPAAFVPRALVIKRVHDTNTDRLRHRHFAALERISDKYDLEREGLDLAFEARRSYNHWARKSLRARDFRDARSAARRSLRYGVRPTACGYWLAAAVGSSWTSLAGRRTMQR